MGFRYVRALIAIAIFVAPLSAHEIGTTRVDVSFHRDHTYAIEIIGSQSTTLAKLQRLAGRPRSNDLTQLPSLEPQLLQSVEVRFNNVRVTPHVTVSAS